MITTEQIIEVAKECGYARTKPHKAMILLAHHFYKQGLIDAADKCEKEDSYCLAEAIRQMAEEVGK